MKAINQKALRDSYRYFYKFWLFMFYQKGFIYV